MFDYFLKHKYLRRGFYVVFGIILYAAVALPTTLTFLAYGHNELGEVKPVELIKSGSEDYIDIELDLLNIDLERRSIKFYATMYPKGKYYYEKDRKWNSDITVDFEGKAYDFKNRTKIESVTFDVGLLSGNIMDYPFDSYKAEIAFRAEETNTTNVIPITIGAYISHSNLKLSFYHVKKYERYLEQDQTYSIILSRTALVYILCLFVSAVTWCLAIILLNFTIDTAYLGRELPLSLPALGVSLLFALPAFRKTQPNIPDIGCAVDFLCFVWCEVIVSICTSVNFLNWSRLLRRGIVN